MSDRALDKALGEVAAHVLEAKAAGPTARIRQGVISAVNAGPPKSLDVQLGGVVYPRLRYVDHGSGVTYTVGQTVLVSTMDGGGHVVLGRLA